MLIDIFHRNWGVDLTSSLLAPTSPNSHSRPTVFPGEKTRQLSPELNAYPWIDLSRCTESTLIFRGGVKKIWISRYFFCEECLHQLTVVYGP
jgi:hypothetical protein